MGNLIDSMQIPHELAIIAVLCQHTAKTVCSTGKRPVSRNTVTEHALQNGASAGPFDGCVSTTLSNTS